MEIWENAKKLFDDFQKLPPKEKEKSAKALGLSGHTVVEVLKLDPKKDGPQIGKIVKAMNDGYLNGEFKTYEEGIEFIRQFGKKLL